MNGYDGVFLDRVSKWRIQGFFILLWLLAGIALIRIAALVFQDVKPPRPVRIGIKTHAPRGEILGRNGFPLATSVGVLKVYAYKNHRSQRKLLRYGLRVPRVKPNRLTYVGELPYSRRTEEALRNARIQGIRLVPGFGRDVPAGKALLPVVGHLRKDEVGGSGLELWLEDLLQGEEGFEVVFVRQRGGRAVLVPPFYPSHRVRPGKPVRVSIDPDISDHLYRLLVDHVQAVEARRGAILVLDPQTGEILAWVEHPPEKGTLRFLTAPYEPGSVMKVATYLTALESGWKLTDTLRVPGRTIRIQRHLFRESSDSAVGWLTLERALVWSSNIATARLAFRIGARELYTTLRRLGIGTPTGITFPGENPGKLRSFATWDSVDLASVAIGQGYLVNALQVALVYAAVANGGKLLPPRLILSVDGQPTTPPPPLRTIADPGTIASLQQAFLQVVERGTGRRARVPGLLVAGKTGTAQKVDSLTGRYSFRKLLTSFVGYFPAEAPEYVIYVLVDEPARGRSGGAVAAPLFREAASWLWHHVSWKRARAKAIRSFSSITR